MSKKLEVRLLGKFEVSRDGKTIAITSRPSQSLFAYLILNAGTSHRREKLAGLLWPDSLEETARENLRHALWHLRKALETASSTRFLHADDATMGIKESPDYWLDTAELEKLSNDASADELMVALSNSQGELLPGFHNEWVVLEREHLHSIFEYHMARLLSLLQDEKRWMEILEWSERWIEFGQKPESAYRALMSAHAAQGDMSKVVATYQRCVKSLEELGVEPSEQTSALYERLKTGKETLETGPTVPIAGKRKETPQTNLPVPLTSFVGREQEVEQVVQLLSEKRLVTLTGPGGVGKTRLAIQSSKQALNDFKDGVWWVELAPLIDEMLVSQAAAQVLGVRETPGEPLIESLKGFLREKQLLLVLDNCEHLINTSAQFSHDLLTQCTSLRILTTSREALDIMGESEYQVQPLSLPAPERQTLVDLLLEYEGIRLFVERAKAKSGFTLTEQNASAVLQICQRLDGIPLALELAAARTRFMSVDQILERLNDRFNLLTQGNRTAFPRHQTLHALIDWSYDLLSEPERALYRRLSVFNGGCTLEAAESVRAVDRLVHEQTSEMLARLVDKSLLIVEEHEGATRYRMLETIRQYGQEKLKETGEESTIRTHHLEFFLQFAEQAETKLVTAEQKKELSQLDAEYGNLWSALAWAMETDSIRAVLLAAALGQYWVVRGYISEGRNVLEKALQQAQNPSVEVRAKGLQWEGQLAARQGDYIRAKARLEESLTLWRELGNKRGTADTLRFLGNIAWVQGDYALAQVAYEQGLALLQAIGDNRGIALVMNNLGNVAIRKGDYAKARQNMEESITIFRELGDKVSLVMALNNLGVVAEEQGDTLIAQRFYEEAITLSHELGEKSFVAYALNGLAHVIYLQGDLIKAGHYYRESLITSQEIGEKRVIVYCLEGFAKVAAHRENATYAAQLLGAAETLREAIGAPLSQAERAELDQDVIETRKRLSDQVFDLAWKEGRVMTLEQAIEFALKENDI